MRSKLNNYSIVVPNIEEFIKVNPEMDLYSYADSKLRDSNSLISFLQKAGMFNTGIYKMYKQIKNLLNTLL